MIKAEFLSGFRLRDQDGASLEVPVAKARGLFAYLALNCERAHRRAALADLLWEAPSDRHARQSLRRCLLDLRSSLGADAEGIFLIDEDRIGIARGAIDIDVVTFRQLVSKGDHTAAVSMLGAGELLEGQAIDVEPFEEWLEQERRSHSELVAEACLAEAERLVPLGQLESARALAERCLQNDPYCEEAYNLLVAIHLQCGRPDLARRQSDRMKENTDCSAGEPLERHPIAVVDRHPRHGHQPCWPVVGFEPLNNMGPDDIPRAISEGLIDDLARAVSRHRLATVSLDLKSNCYKVDGAIRKSGQKFRASLRLIDVEDGTLLWSEAFDGSTAELLESQERIAVMAASRIMTSIGATESTRLKKNQDGERSAYAIWQRARRHCLLYTKHDNDTAKRLCLEAIRADPEFDLAYVTLSEAETMDALFGYGGDRQASLERAVALAKTAISIDPSSPGAHVAHSNALARLMDFDGAVVAAEAAAGLCPSYSGAQYANLVAFYYAGLPQKALEAASDAIRLDPMNPEIWTRYQMTARSFFDLGQYENALRYAHKASLSPNAKQVTLALKAAAAQKLGVTNLARLAARELMNRDPMFTADFVVNHLGNERIYDHVCEFADLLKQAGVPA